MPARKMHFYEKSLFEAIEARDEIEAKNLIKRIRKVLNASLTTVNEQNQNFLLCAFKYNLKTVAEELLKYLNDSPHIIFQPDKENKTVIWYAAKTSYFEMMAQLITIANNAEEKFAQKPWLLPDINGVTPLHIAASCNNDKILKILLEAIKKESDASQHINRGDKNADTAFHKSIEIHATECCALLISYGANFNIHNNKKVILLEAFLRLPQEEQFSIFALLDNANKKRMLDIYRNKLKSHAKNDAIRSIYFRLQGTTNLQSLLFAHHEFGDAPLRATYNKTQRLEDRKNLSGRYPVITQEENLTDDVLERMPIYKIKLDQAILESDETLGTSLKLIDISQSISKTNPHDKVDMLDNDRLNLIALIEDIDIFLQDLQNRRSFFYSDRALAVLIPIIMWAALAGLMVGLYFVGEKNQTEHYRHKHWSFGYEIFYTMAICVGGVAGFFATLGLCDLLCNSEARTYKREWNNILKNLEKNVNEKLQILEKKSTDKDYLLPIPVNKLRDLEQLTDQIKHTQTISTAKDIFYKLKNILQTVLEEMNKTNRPLSLFSPRDTIIDMPNQVFETQLDEALDDFNAEELPLLRYQG